MSLTVEPTIIDRSLSVGKFTKSARDQILISCTVNMLFTFSSISGLGPLNLSNLNTHAGTETERSAGERELRGTHFIFYSLSEILKYRLVG